MRIAITVGLVLVSAPVRAMMGEDPGTIARKMGKPITTGLRPLTQFPQMTYALVHTGTGWLAVDVVKAELENAANRSRIRQIEGWLEEKWAVSVVYVDDKSMCEAWLPIDDQRITPVRARLVRRLYEGDRAWTKLGDEDAKELAAKLQQDLHGNAGHPDYICILKAADDSMYLIVCETYISVIASEYPERVRPARIAGEKRLLARFSHTALVLLDWHWKIRYGHAIAEGQVMNVSERKLERVQALASFKNADGELVTSASSLIEFQPLMPGQTSPFKIYAGADRRIKTATVNFKTMLGPAIPFMSKDEWEQVKAIVQRREDNQ